jgi:hypothetical protein
MCALKAHRARGKNGKVPGDSRLAIRAMAEVAACLQRDWLHGAAP